MVCRKKHQMLLKTNKKYRPLIRPAVHEGKTNQSDPINGNPQALLPQILLRQLDMIFQNNKN